MAFTFGGVSPIVKPQSAVKESFDFVLKDTRIAGVPWYLILLPGIPHRAEEDKYSKSNEKVSFLAKDIIASGISSFVIASVTNTFFVKEEEKSIMDFLKSYGSAWPSLLSEEPKAIVTMGAALYAVNKSTDVLPDDFLPVFVRPYLWSHVYDVNVFPAHATDDVYTSPGDMSWRRTWFRKQLKNAQEDDLWVPDLRPPVLHTIRTVEEAAETLIALMDAECLAADTETSSFDYMTGRLGCVTLCDDGENGYYIPWRLIEEGELQSTLAKVFKTAKTLVGANAKFDTHWLWKFGVDEMKWHFNADIGQLSHAIVPGRTVALKPLAILYTNFGGYDDKLDEAKKSLKVTDYLQIPEDILSKYATLDAIATWRIWEALVEQCHEIDEKFPNEKQIDLKRVANDGRRRWGQSTDDLNIDFRIGKPWTIWRWYSEVMMPMANECADLEYLGLYVSLEQQRASLKILQDELTKERKALAEAWNVPEDFDFLSNKQLGELLNKMGWNVERTDKGQWALDDSVLQDFIRDKRPGAKNLKRLRSVSTQMGTFVGYEEDGVARGWLQYYRYHQDDDTYRIHTQFASMLAETFRHRSASPNFQNITSRGEFADLIKKTIDVKHTFQYRVKSNGIEYVFPYNAKVKTLRGEVLAKDLKATDDLITDDSYQQYKVTKTRTIKT
jgi:hypothetical protein